MAPETFDPYHRWLGIPPSEQPPNLYRLLGLSLFESDASVIESAADRQMAHVRSFASGPHSAASQRLLNEISAAKLCLLNQKKRAAYDHSIGSQAATPPLPPTPTVQLAAPMPALTANALAPGAASKTLIATPVHNRERSKAASYRLPTWSICAVALVIPICLFGYRALRPHRLAEVAALQIAASRQPDVPVPQRGQSEPLPPQTKRVDAQSLPTVSPLTVPSPSVTESPQPRPQIETPPPTVPPSAPSNPSSSVAPNQSPNLPPSPPGGEELSEGSTRKRPPLRASDSPTEALDLPPAATEPQPPRARQSAPASMSSWTSPISLPDGTTLRPEEVLLEPFQLATLEDEMPKTAYSCKNPKSPTGELLVHAAYSLKRGDSLNLDGWTICRYDNGSPKLAVEFDNDDRNGPLRFWEADGTLRLYATYAKDRLHGLACLLENGMPTIVMNYQGGRLKAKYLVDYSSGRPVARAADKLGSVPTSSWSRFRQVFAPIGTGGLSDD